MADIKVDFKYAGVEQSEIQKYEKDIKEYAVSHFYNIFQESR